MGMMKQRQEKLIMRREEKRVKVPEEVARSGPSTPQSPWPEYADGKRCDYTTDDCATPNAGSDCAACVADADDTSCCSDTSGPGCTCCKKCQQAIQQGAAASGI